MSTQESQLTLQIKEAKISEPDALALQQTFAPFFQEAEKWRAKAESIQVTSIEDKAMMKEARETRLALKDIRVNVEKARKELKEESLRKGKAIDGMANIIKFLIVPLEEHLEKQENFAAIEAEKAKQALKEQRQTELSAYNVDTTYYNLAEMPDESYQKLLETSRLNHQLAKEAQEKVERERIEREKAEAEERERMRIENERLKKEAEERQMQIDEERKAKEKIEAELRAKKQEEERIERERLSAEKKAKFAPDKEKLMALADSIAAFPMPEVSSKEAKAVIEKTIELLSKASQFVKTQSINL